MQAIRSGTGVEVSFDGLVTGSEILEASEEIYRVVPLASQRFQLWDYSGASGLRATSAQVREVADFDKACAAQRQSRLFIAVVQPTDLGYGLGRMYGVFADGPNWITAHFRTRAEAERWLDENL